MEQTFLEVFNFFVCSPEKDQSRVLFFVCVVWSITGEEIVSVKLHYNLLWTLERRGCWEIVAGLH